MKVTYEHPSRILSIVAKLGGMNLRSNLSKFYIQELLLIKMSEVATPVAAATPVAVKKVKKVSSATKKPKTKPTHPPTSEMVDAAIGALKERGGSSLLAIKKYVAATYKVDVEKLAPFLKKYIKGAVIKGHLLQTKGKGASGSFKLSAKPAKKTVAKPKTTTPKKAAAKPKAAEKKKAAAKKPAAKKPVAAKKAVKTTAAKKTGTVKAKPAAAKPKATPKPKIAAAPKKAAAPKAKKPAAKKAPAKK